MPSTTIIAEPEQLMPAYNPIKYIIDNTNKNEPGFRYIFTIYPATGSHIPGNVVGQYKVLPAFSTGYGEQDISKLMQSSVHWDYPTQNPAIQSWYQYDVDLGFEFIDNEFYSAALADLGGNVQITINSHPFIVGDQIIINQTGTGPADNPALEGLHTVLSVTANNFTVNVLFSTITNINADGDITYADRRKTITLDDVLITNKEVFNGAFNNYIYDSGGAFPSVDYDGISPNGNFITTALSGSSNVVSINATDNRSHYLLRVYAGNTYDITFEDDLAATYVQTFTPASNGLYAIYVGPLHVIMHLTGPNYKVYVTSTSGFNTNEYYFSIDERCAVNEDNFLTYLDRMGSWQTFHFPLKMYEKGQITRNEFNQHIDGEIVSTAWVQDYSAMGFKTYNNNFVTTFDLNTNWMDQYNSNRFQELLTSPQVFFNSDIFGIASCLVESTGFEVFRQRNKNLIKHSVTVKMSIQAPVNG